MCSGRERSLLQEIDVVGIQPPGPIADVFGYDFSSITAIAATAHKAPLSIILKVSAVFAAAAVSKNVLCCYSGSSARRGLC